MSNSKDLMQPVIPTPVNVVEVTYKPATDSRFADIYGYIREEDINSLIEYDSKQWHELVRYKHAPYCFASKISIKSLAYRICNALPFINKRMFWLCDCFDDISPLTDIYKIPRGYVEVELKDSDISHLVRKELLLTQVWKESSFTDG